MRLTEETLGELHCRVVESTGAEPPDLTVVLCHGFGAPGEDLVPLGAEIVRQRPDLEGRVRLVFPEAPLALADLMPGIPGVGFGRAWWMLDPQRLAAISSGAARDDLPRMRAEEPEGLSEARDKLLTVLDRLVEDGTPRDRIVLGGFSQGAMLATDVALSLDVAPAALLVLSGTLICEPRWRDLAPKRAGLRVLQTHGRADPLLPFENATALRDLLRESGLEVAFHPFEGEHTIPPQGLEWVGALLADRLGAGA